jgi:hypothetical protein
MEGVHGDRRVEQLDMVIKSGNTLLGRVFEQRSLNAVFAYNFFCRLISPV